jgi:hypothetical protein
MIMLRKALIVLAAAASIGLLAPGMAQARGGMGGHGGMGGGMGGHGMGGHVFGGHGFGRGIGIGAFGLGLGYGYYDYSYPYYGDYYADDGGGCYVVRQRIHTRYGWRVRPVEVCG